MVSAEPDVILRILLVPEAPAKSLDVSSGLAMRIVSSISKIALHPTNLSSKANVGPWGQAFSDSTRPKELVWVVMFDSWVMTTGSADTPNQVSTIGMSNLSIFQYAAWPRTGTWNATPRHSK